MIFLPIDKQPKHNEFNEIVDSAWVLGYERNIPRFLDFTSDNGWRTFNNCIFFDLLFFLMKFVCYLLLSLLHFLSKSLYFSTAFLLVSFNFALRRFYPTERYGQIYAHKDMFCIIYKRNSVGDILLIANLIVFCILIESSFIFADSWLMLVLLFV
jgi:hypothetical protein